MAEAESGLVINGEALKVDLVEIMSSLDMDEAQVLFDVSGVVQEDFVPPHPEAPKAEQRAHEEHVSRTIRNPAFKRGVTCIAYMRAHPDADRQDVLELVGKVRQLDVSLALAGGDDSPPEETGSPNEPEKLTPSAMPSSSAASTSPSTNGSDQPEEPPEATGTSESDTSFPRLAPTT